MTLKGNYPVSLLVKFSYTKSLLFSIGETNWSLKVKQMQLAIAEEQSFNCCKWYKIV